MNNIKSIGNQLVAESLSAKPFTYLPRSKNKPELPTPHQPPTPAAIERPLKEKKTVHLKDYLKSGIAADNAALKKKLGRLQFQAILLGITVVAVALVAFPILFKNDTIINKLLQHLKVDPELFGAFKGLMAIAAVPLYMAASLFGDEYITNKRAQENNHKDLYQTIDHYLKNLAKAKNEESLTLNNDQVQQVMTIFQRYGCLTEPLLVQMQNSDDYTFIY